MATVGVEEEYIFVDRESLRPINMGDSVRSELLLLDAALWHAARDGITNSLLHPVTHEMRPAGEIVDAMLFAITPQLEQEGDVERVQDLLVRVRTDGTGADRQRAAMRAGGRPKLRDLYTRSLTARM